MIELTNEERCELQRHRITLSQMTGDLIAPFAADFQRRVQILDGLLARDAAANDLPPGHNPGRPASVSPGGVEDSGTTNNTENTER